MLRKRFFPVTILIATSLFLGACDSSSGSLISSDIKDLLDPNAQSDSSTDSTPDSTDDSSTDNTNDNNARVSTDPDLNGANPLAPVVTSVSSTITIRGADIVLLVQGSNLPDNLQINLDNDVNQCQVSQLLPANSTSNLANTLEAVCTTSAIVNRQVFVRSVTGIEIQGSPLNFSASNISVDSSSTNNISDSTTNSDSTANQPEPASQANTSANQDDEPIPGLSQLAQTFINTPTNLTLLDANAGIRLSWDPVARVEGYNIFVSKSPSPQAGASGVTAYTTTLPTIEITDVDAGDTYYVSVSAHLNGNESSLSEDLIVQVTNAVQSKYGVLTEISGSGDSLATNGIEIGSNATSSVDQSTDGRYTVFLSSSDNLANTQLRGFTQVFLHDKEDNEITLISQSGSGEPANRDTSHPRISNDGSAVVFVSAASNLDRQVLTTGRATQVFLTSTLTASTSLISRSVLNGNRAANYNSFAPVIDADGTNIVFASFADDLTSGSKTQSSHLYHFNVPAQGLSKLATHRDTTPAGLTATAQADAITPNADYLFYRLNIPGTSPSIHRIDLQNLTQQNLNFGENVSLSGAYVHGVSNDGDLVLLGLADDTKTGLYSLKDRSLKILGSEMANTKPKGLSGDGNTAVLWSDEDLLPNNATPIEGSGNHYIESTRTGYLKESSLNIQSISNDGLVLLYTIQTDDSSTVQLQSIQH